MGFTDHFVTIRWRKRVRSWSNPNKAQQITKTNIKSSTRHCPTGHIYLKQFRLNVFRPLWVAVSCLLIVESFGILVWCRKYLENQCFKYIIFEITCIFSLVVNLKPTLDKGVSALIYGEPGLKTRKLLKLENKIVSADNTHSASQCWALLSI